MGNHLTVGLRGRGSAANLLWTRCYVRWAWDAVVSISLWRTILPFTGKASPKIRVQRATSQCSVSAADLECGAADACWATLHRDAHLHSEHAGDPHERGERGIAVRSERLVDPDSDHAGLVGEFGDAVGPGDVAQRGADAWSESADASEVATECIKTLVNVVQPVRSRVHGRFLEGHDTDRVDSEEIRIRTVFALRFGHLRAENDENISEDMVRAAFNSPFRPLVSDIDGAWEGTRSGSSTIFASRKLSLVERSGRSACS